MANIYSHFPIKGTKNMMVVLSVVSHNQQELVSNFLASIDKFLKVRLHDVKIIITENTLIENTANSQRFDVVRINNLRPKGFGANHNTVFEFFESDFFLIINPDILLKDSFDLDLFISQMIDNNLDLSSPKITNKSGHVEDYKREDLTLTNIFKRKILKIENKKFDWLAGMFLAVKSDSFRKLNGFDVRFFMYVEDCDLSMRARKFKMELNDLRDFSVVHDARRASRKNLKHLKWHLSSLIKYLLFK